MDSKPSSAMLRGESTKEGKDAITSSYVAAEVYRQRAVAYLQNKWHTVHEKQVSEKGYESPAWAQRQADYNGVLRTIEEVLHEVFNVKAKNYGTKNKEDS